MTYYSATTATRSFKIQKINFLDKIIFKRHRRNIASDFYLVIERAQSRLDTKLRVLQQEYDSYLAEIHQILSAVMDVPFSRKRFICHNIRGCHCKFCSTWSQHRWYTYRLQEVSDKRRLAYSKYDDDFKYLVELKTKNQNDLERLRDMQLANKRAANIRQIS